MARPRLPGQHRKSFRVDVGIPGKPVTAIDGMSADHWSKPGDLMQYVSYIGDLERLDGRWTLALQWVDLENNGHRVIFPHEVVERVLGHADGIMALSRSDRAATAAQTRRRNTADDAQA